MLTVNTTNEKALRTAAYIRVSTEKEEQENSLELQQKYFTKLLSESDTYVNAGIYADRGISGTSDKNRTAFRNLLNDCKSGKIDRIVCKSISRFSRNTLDLIQTLSLLKENHVTILFEKENIDTAVPINDIAITTLAAAAQKESQDISENINWANEKRYQCGEVPNRVIYGYRFVDSENILPSGYRYRNVEIVPEEAAVVRRIFRKVAGGMKYAEIARRLNAQNIPAPRQNAQWNGRHISGIIMNERYTGSVITQKTFTTDCNTHQKKTNRGEMDRYMIRNHHPAIIDMTLFERVQAIRKKNSECHGTNQTGHRKTQILSGLLLCPSCGRKLHTNGRNRTPYWFCPDKCGRRIDEAAAFRLIRQAMATRFGGGKKLSRNIRSMLKTTESIRERKNQTDSELTAVLRKTDIIKLQKKTLALKLRSITDSKAKEILSCNIALLDKRLCSENRYYHLLKNRLEEFIQSEKHCLAYFDLQRTLLNRLDTIKDTETLMQHHLNAIILSIDILSADQISVRWVDHTVTTERSKFDESQ